MATPQPTTTQHQNVFFSPPQISEVLGGTWLVAEGASPQRNAFANAPETACTDALRIIYKREEPQPDSPAAAIVHNVLISQHHNGARTMFMAITDKVKSLSITPINLFPGLQPLAGAEAPIDGRWVDPASATALATYEFTRAEDQLKQVSPFLFLLYSYFSSFFGRWSTYE